MTPNLDRRPVPKAHATCPHCRADVRGAVHDIATTYTCPACGLEWAEDLVLDFRTD